MTESGNRFWRRQREAAVTGISTVLAQVSGLGLAIIFGINILQIIARPIMGGWIWVNDLSRLLIAWVIMIGAAAAYGMKEHLVVDFLADRMPSHLWMVNAVVLRGLEILLGVILLVAGLVVAVKRMSIRYIQLGIPTGWAYASVPALGFFLIVFGLTMTIEREQSILSQASRGDAK